jgi:hypothetical protein
VHRSVREVVKSLFYLRVHELRATRILLPDLAKRELAVKVVEH